MVLKNVRSVVEFEVAGAERAEGGGVGWWGKLSKVVKSEEDFDGVIQYFKSVAAENEKVQYVFIHHAWNKDGEGFGGLQEKCVRIDGLTTDTLSEFLSYNETKKYDTDDMEEILPNIFFEYDTGLFITDGEKLLKFFYCYEAYAACVLNDYLVMQGHEQTFLINYKTLEYKEMRTR